METPSIPAPKLPSRIVVGLDEVGLADEAARTALALGGKLRARVEFVHVVPKLPESWPQMDVAASVERTRSMMDAAQNAALTHVRNLLAGAKARGVEAEDVLRVVEGRPEEALLSSVQGPSDWLVLGGRRRAGRFHFGGTLRGLMAKSPCPLLVQGGPSRGLGNLLAPIDLSPNSLHALALAIELARAIRARVHVLYAHHLAYPWTSAWAEGYATSPMLDFDALEASARKQLEDVVSSTDWRGVEHDHAFVEGEPARTIVERAAEHDLVVMGSRGHGAMAAALLGSVAMHTLEHCDGPLLFVPHRAT